ncbi:DnaD domain-containing protein [Paenibacillus lemnae]|uniref:DnaD domain protein n=1 Tax=Paenibacillus lemnae TaxID=1330551 RepID=A0A848MCY2_PAELE|nr:DnaD domain protein [Paenibacillus lemnae]NMO98000.1 DnaD domain protein [Paenibacillus lemnae]
MNNHNKQELSKAWAAGAAVGMNQGIAMIPYSLLRFYRRLDLSDSDCMLLVHLLGFGQVEHNAFPSLEELQEVTGTPSESIAASLQRLMKEQWITIDEYTDAERGIQFERYNLQGTYLKLAEFMAEEQWESPVKETVSRNVESSRKPAGKGASTPAEPRPHIEQEKEERNMFTIFEKEFGRPLSPMELETISGWIDQDRYPDELILLALKEAVFAGKVHLRYIDRILLEWSRNRVRTAQDAKAYTQKFRNIGR